MGRLLKMKADHEGRATPIADEFADRAARLLIDQNVVSVNQSGGITARNVYVTTAPSRDEPADRRAVLARVENFHQERTKKLTSAVPQVPVLDGGVLLMHVVPLQTFDDPQPAAFATLSANPMRFPPIVDTRPRHWKINFDGLFTGSNNDGLGKPHRAYVHVFRSGAVEAVVSSRVRGRAGNGLQLPNIQCMIIHYARVYAAALQRLRHSAALCDPGELGRRKGHASLARFYWNGVCRGFAVWPTDRRCSLLW